MIAVDRAIGEKWLVASGLAAGDRVIVEGMQKVRPGPRQRPSPSGLTAPRQGRPPGRLRPINRGYMMLSKFFLDRPVFAWVIAIIIMLAGALAIYRLPVAQYPPVAPPSIYIQAFYPGASAETVENTVTQIIEQKMTGIDKMIYLSATSDSSGVSRTELTFAPGMDPDLAWAKVQNKLQLAMASLPQVVQLQGISVGKATQELPDGRRPDIGRRQHGRQRPQGLRPVKPRKGAGPRARRRRGGGVRNPVRDARLAQPRQADQLFPHRGRRCRTRSGHTTSKCPPASSAGCPP